MVRLITFQCFILSVYLQFSSIYSLKLPCLAIDLSTCLLGKRIPVFLEFWLFSLAFSRYNVVFLSSDFSHLVLSLISGVFCFLLPKEVSSSVKRKQRANKRSLAFSFIFCAHITFLFLHLFL